MREFIVSAENGRVEPSMNEESEDLLSQHKVCGMGYWPQGMKNAGWASDLREWRMQDGLVTSRNEECGMG